MSWFNPIEKSETPAKRNTIPVMGKGDVVHLWNEQKLSLHALIEELIDQCGQTVLYVATWSLSVPAMKTLIRLKAEGKIRLAYGVVDFRTRKDHPEAWDMALQYFDKLSIFPCHAKVVVLGGLDKELSIIGSANLTLNPKMERLAVVSTPEVISIDKNMIMTMLKEGEQVK